MNISTLQSLIDRTSNDIALYERCINLFWHDNKTVARYNTTLKKLRKIQKELKKEIARAIYRAKVDRIITEGWKSSLSIDK